MTVKSAPLLILLSLLGGLVQTAMAADQGASNDAELPRALIERTASALQSRLDGRQNYFSERPAELYALINEVLLPSFDVPYAGKLVLGRQHWTAASEDQRARFIEAFYSFLVKTYSKAVLNFDQDNLSVQPTPSFSSDGDRALVRTSIKVEGGDVLQVHYALRQLEADWKIYDVRVDGVSYIQNYRSQFDAEITELGIDSVIQRLEAEAAELDLRPGALDIDSANAA